MEVVPTVASKAEPCPFHIGCSLPCAREAALHLEISTGWMGGETRKLVLAAQRRGGQKGGQNHYAQKFVPKAKRLLTVLPEPSTTVSSKSTR
jgi:hypothetical protein